MSGSFKTPKTFDELETRLAASLLYKTLRDAGPFVDARFIIPEGMLGGLTLEELLRATSLEIDLAMHALTWMRFHNVDLRVFVFAGEPSVWAARPDRAT